MLKNILIKCSELIGRDDIISAIKNIDDADNIENVSLKNDVVKLISFYNYVTNNVYENYLDLNFSENVKSDFERKIYYHDLYYYPIKIIELSDNQFEYLSFKSKPNYIEVNEPNKIYTVKYKYVPDAIENLNDKVFLPKAISRNIICFGMASEFLASKGQYNQSEFWKNKFLYEIFKIKTHKERHLKSTFCK